MLLILWHDYCIAGSWSIQPFRSNTLLIANWLCFLLEIYWCLAGQLPGSSLPNIGAMFPNMLPFGVAGQVIPFFNVFYLIKNLHSFFIFIMPGLLFVVLWLCICLNQFNPLVIQPQAMTQQVWFLQFLIFCKLTMKIVPTSFPFRLLVMLGVFMLAAFLHQLTNRSIY
jgi:hypothetical protein